MGQNREAKYADGSMYIGDFDSQGKKHGRGDLTFADKSTYRGEFEDGLFHGHGILQIPDPETKGFHKYQGQFQQGKFSGYGIFTKTDNMKFEGQFKDGKIHGLGKMTFKDGTQGLPRFEGHFEDGRFVRPESCATAIQNAIDSSKTAEKK